MVFLDVPLQILAKALVLTTDRGLVSEVAPVY